MEAQQIELERVLDIPVLALTAEHFDKAFHKAVNKFEEALQKTVDQVKRVQVQDLEHGKDIHAYLTLTRDIFDTLQDKILEQRSLTAKESRLLAELDKAIGDAGQRAANIVSVLKKFEAIGNDSIFTVH
jgi:flavin-binding protein dodecin